jgi:transposase
VPVAIETPRGLLTACLRATGRPVYPVNPLSVARYRDRHSVAGRKSDHGDAYVLANILRTDREMHRPLPADSELGQAIAVLARAQQDAVWDRTTAHNKLRSHLREYYPGFLAAFASAYRGILRADARIILAAAPTPADAATLTLAQLRALLKRAGRARGIDAEAVRLRGIFRQPQMRQLPLVEQAMGRQTLALLRQLDAACAAADDLKQAAAESFDQHPDAGLITSFPGLGALTGARVLGEIGDDRSRFADAKGLKAYAGAAPVTKASGKTRTVQHRRVKNQRLATAGYSWAFSALSASPGARYHYDRRRTAGDRHAAAQRNLFNRLLGCLHHCLATSQHYNENTAFPPPAQPQHAIAA